MSLVRCEPEADGASSGSSYHRGRIVDIGDDHGSTAAHAVFSQQVCDRVLAGGDRTGNGHEDRHAPNSGTSIARSQTQLAPVRQGPACGHRKGREG